MIILNKERHISYFLWNFDEPLMKISGAVDTGQENGIEERNEYERWVKVAVAK